MCIQKVRTAAWGTGPTKRMNVRVNPPKKASWRRREIDLRASRSDRYQKAAPSKTRAKSKSQIGLSFIPNNLSFKSQIQLRYPSECWHSTSDEESLHFGCKRLFPKSQFKRTLLLFIHSLHTLIVRKGYPWIQLHLQSRRLRSERLLQ